MSSQNAESFIAAALLPQQAAFSPFESPADEAAPLDLDKLPGGVVSGNALVDLSAMPEGNLRSAVSIALLFAGRVADAAVQPGDDEDDWLAHYHTNMRKLGFGLSQSALSVSRFKKDGVLVHKAIIPFLTIAFGGAGLGPVVLAALEHLSSMDEKKRWITLFDRETRKFETREMHFAAVSTEGSETVIRHVVARLNVESKSTNVLFFRITKATAEFESSTTTMRANNELLSVIEPKLRERMHAEIGNFIAEASYAGSITG